MDLTDAFKARIGITSTSEECSREVCELEMSLDVEKEATLSKFKFAKFMKENFLIATATDSESFTREPIKQPLLSKKSEVDRLVGRTRVWRLT